MNAKPSKREDAAGADWGVLAPVVAELTDEDRQRLAASFGVSYEQVERCLADAARAAMREYLDQFLGRNVPSTIRETREYRLQLLCREAFPGGMPPTNVVSDLFQLTAAQARTLVRNTRTRYRFNLQDHLREAIGAVLDAGAKQKDGDLVVEIRDDALLEYAKELVRRGAGNPPPIEAGEETHKYVLKPATSRVLRAAAGRA